MTTMISQALNNAINAQIGREFGASLQYLQIASYFEGAALEQTADLFFKQADEERDHAMKFLKYILDAGGTVQIPAIDEPKATFSSAEEAVSLALRWEIDVTEYINRLMETAMNDKDYIARQFLDWFTNEQLEEVSTMDKLLRVVKSVGDRNIYMLEAYISHLG